MATQHVVPLTGRVNGKPANTLQAGDVTMVFVGNADKTPGYFQVSEPNEKRQIILTTPKGSYLLVEGIAGVYKPLADSNLPRLQISLKKISGKLIYWA